YQLAVAEPQQDEPDDLALVNHATLEHAGVELALLAHLVGDESGPAFLELHAGLSGGPIGRCVETIYPAPLQEMSGIRTVREPLRGEAAHFGLPLGHQQAARPAVGLVDDLRRVDTVGAEGAERLAQQAPADDGLHVLVETDLHGPH